MGTGGDAEDFGAARGCPKLEHPHEERGHDRGPSSIGVGADD
jgi:hypothetical protein